VQAVQGTKAPSGQRGTWQPEQGRYFSFYQEGGNILTDFLGGQNMKKKIVCKKNYFLNSGGKCPPGPPPNDVPE